MHQNDIQRLLHGRKERKQGAPSSLSRSAAPRRTLPKTAPRHLEGPRTDRPRATASRRPSSSWPPARDPGDPAKRKRLGGEAPSRDAVACQMQRSACCSRIRPRSPSRRPLQIRHASQSGKERDRETERQRESVLSAQCSVLRFSLLDASPSLGSLSSRSRCSKAQTSREQASWAAARQEATVSVASDHYSKQSLRACGLRVSAVLAVGRCVGF